MREEDYYKSLEVCDQIVKDSWFKRFVEWVVSRVYKL
jgi:hypothetical protein